MAVTARKPATAQRVHIQQLLDALDDAGSPGALTPRVLQRTQHLALRRPRPVFVDGPAVYPLGPLPWFWETIANRTVRPAGITVADRLLIALPDAVTGEPPARWRPVHSELLSITAADIDAVAARLQRLAAAQGIVVPVDPDASGPGWTGDVTVAQEHA